ncbi:MAG TPA: DUF2723 domain-containing protein [Candidatus Saccharimonadales bacterium]|nr:DUF2723 domain-containing protein [Candidatus Saccharimonadales bacterium]
MSSDPHGATSGRDRLLAAGLAAALFTFYGLGASRTIYVGDSGELTTAVYLLGIPHPSGYPLFVLLGKLWTLLVPAGSIAFRMSLFSAACAGAACGLLFLLGRAMRLAMPAAILGSLILAFSPSFWSQSNIQRVYTLDALFVALATFAAWKWHESAGGGSGVPASPAQRDRWLILCFFLCGLGASNHLFMGVLGVCAGIYAVFRSPRILSRPATIAWSGAAMAAGLLPYLYLPLRSRMDPRLDWGNPETLSGFLHVVFREDFWNRAWIERPLDLVPITIDYLHGLGLEMAWAGLLLALAGLLLRPRLGRFVVLPLMVMGTNLATMALHGSRTDIFIWHRYYIPSYIMAALLAAAGWDAILLRLHDRAAAPPGSAGEKTSGSRSLRAASLQAAGWLALAVPAVLLASGWGEFDRSRYRVAEAFSREVLASVPPGTHLIATDDNILFTCMYLNFVEGVRPDIDLILQGVGEAQLPPLKFNPDTDPVYFTHHPNWNQPGLEIVPVGLTFRAWRAGRPWPEPSPVPPRLAGEDDPRVPKDYLTQNLIGQFHYMKGVTAEPRDWINAEREFRKAMSAAPHNDVLFYNLGLIYRRNGLLDQALAMFRRSHELNPRHLASNDRPNASDRIDEVTAELQSLHRLEAQLSEDPSLQGLAPESEKWHLGMAALLASRGEEIYARGHSLRALEIASRATGG